MIIQISIKRITRLLAAVLVFQCLPINSSAATLTDCIEQSNASMAIAACRELLSNGQDDPDIYIRLINALNASQKIEESLSVATEAAKKYPNHKEISSIKSIVASNQSEIDFVRQQTQKAPSSATVSKASLRISRAKCLKSSDQSALDACSVFIAAGGNDPQVNDRLASLLATITPPAATNEIELSESSNNNIDTLREEPVDDPVVVATPQQYNSGPNVQRESDNRQRRERRQLVTRIQTALNELGFDAGTPDGAAGNRTKTAIDRFYQTTNISSRKSVGDSLLTDLTQAQRSIGKARTILQQSETALLNDNPELAASLLEIARSTATWLAVPTTLDDRIALAIDTKKERENLRNQQQRENELIATIQRAIEDANLPATNSALQTALQEFPNSTELSTLQQEYEFAIQAQKNAEQKQQSLNRISSLLDQSKSLASNNQFAAALDAVTRANAIDSTNTDIKTTRTRIIEQQTLYESQLRTAELIENVQQQTQSGNFDTAQRALDEALAIAPTNPQVLAADTLLQSARENAAVLLASNSTPKVEIPRADDIKQPDTNPADVQLSQKQEEPGSAQLEELLQRGKIMRALHERNRFTLVEYFENKVPDALERLFPTER